MPDLARVIRDDLRPDAERTRKQVGGCVLSLLRMVVLAGFMVTIFGIAIYRSLEEDRTSTRSARILDLRWRRTLVLERHDGDGSNRIVTRRLETSGSLDEKRLWPEATPSPGERIGTRDEVFLVSLRTDGETRPLLYTTRRFEDIKGIRVGQTVTVRLTPDTLLCVESLTR